MSIVIYNIFYIVSLFSYFGVWRFPLSLAVKMHLFLGREFPLSGHGKVENPLRFTKWVVLFKKEIN
ncbi:hypothetical protein DOZ91_17170 [Peribacillus frigoritolerans]|nr:hypothetical protein DOZ91_17170 [Peribacillus frigoritolerans]